MMKNLLKKMAAPAAALGVAASLMTAWAPTAGAAFYPPMSAPEYQFLAMLNQDRAQNGEGALAIDGTLSGLAHQRSQSMAAGQAAFSHYNSAGQLVFQGLLNSVAYPYAAAGENIAENNYGDLMTSLDVANTGFMNSAGHRANILNTNYNTVGIGIAGPDGAGRFYYTELFAQVR
ncbi:MAG: CAP domain-containing protein [Chloroflexi bacterium]|nr:CAP domain-containing protein [Chloroflexota bacterium]